MAMTEFCLDSHGKGKLHCCKWTPTQTPKAVVQIVHGIAEYAGRYDAFARFLNAKGIAVVAEDHMGHGKSVGSDLPLGYFYGGWLAAVADSYSLMKKTMAEYPGIPYILFGHSMGSFLSRTLLYTYPESGIRGVILCGTGWQSRLVLGAGLGVCRLFCKAGEESKPSPKLEKLMFGAYNKGISPVRTNYDWLNRDEEAVQAYLADPLCGFAPSAGLARDMLTGISMNQNHENLSKMKKALPVLFIAGDADPVGSWGTGVRRTANAFCAAGMQDVRIRLYPGGRHEILNEINKTEVYQDILTWILEKV